MNILQIIHGALKELLDSCIEVAFKDGQITQDEAALLESFGDHLINIETELEPIVHMVSEENLSEEEIKHRVLLIARDIIPELTKVAEKDGIIVSDEAAILNRVLKDIME